MYVREFALGRVILAALLLCAPPYPSLADAHSTADKLAYQAGIAEYRGSLTDAIKLRTAAWQYYKTALLSDPKAPLLQEWSDENLIHMVRDLVKTRDVALLTTVLRAMMQTTARSNDFPLLTGSPNREYFEQLTKFYDSVGALETWDPNSDSYYFTEGLESARKGDYKEAKRFLEYGFTHRDPSLNGERFTYLLAVIDLALGQKQNAISNFYNTLLHPDAKPEPGLLAEEVAAAAFLSQLPRAGL